MENQWSSSGWWIQDTLRCTFSSRSKNYWRTWIVNQNNSKEESSSCRCTTTSCGDSQNERVCLANAIFVTTYAKKFSSDHWSFLGSGSVDRTRLYLELDLNRGSEFRTDLTNSWEIWQRKHEFHVKMMILQQAQDKNRELWNILDQEQINLQRKQNQSRHHLLPHHLLRRVFHFLKAFGLTLNHESIRRKTLKVFRFQRGWLHCSDTDLFLETKMEQLKFGDRRWNLGH